MSQRTNQQQRPFRFWFPLLSNPTQRPSPERPQPQRSPTQSRSSTSRQPTASSAQRSQPSDSPSPSRRSSLPTNTNDPTRKQLPSTSTTKPSSPARLPSKMKIQDPMDSLGKPEERAAHLRQPDGFNETKPKRDKEKKLDEAKAEQIPRSKVGQADSKPKDDQGDSSEEGTVFKINDSDSDTKVKQDKVEKEEAKPAYPEPFRQDLGDSDQQKSIKKPEEFPQLTAKQSSSEPQQQTEASNQQKIYEKPEEITRMETTETDSIPKQNTKPLSKQKQHDITKNIPEVNTNQEETTEKPSRISEDKSIPALDADKGTHKAETKTEILGKAHSSTSEKADLDSKVERGYKINGDKADEPWPKNGGPMHAAKENMTDKGSMSAKIRKEHESSEKGSKISISTGPQVAFADGERAGFQKEIKEGLSKLVGKLDIGQSGNLRADPGVCILTLAGKNKGAVMKIGNGNAKGSKKSKDEKKHNDKERTEMAASVNSNVQSINNSLLNESKCKENSPGVHLVVSDKAADGTGLKKKIETLLSQNSSLSIPTAQKLSYEPPNVRRRCLRGLMMEPSEDEEGTLKPRRHGCRVGVGCDDKRKEKEDIDEITSKRPD